MNHGYWVVLTQHEIIFKRDSTRREVWLYCVCSLITPAIACLENAVQGCGDEISQDARRQLAVVQSLSNYICVEEFEGQ